MRDVIIVGAGGHAKVIADIIKLNGDRIVGYLDDRLEKCLSEANVIGTINDIGIKECWYFVAIGNCGIRKKLMEHKLNWYTAIHPRAIIADGVEIGEGSCVMANAVINPGVEIGRGTIINTAATVDHDCIIGRYVHVSPGVHICGNVNVGEGNWIGVGSSISNNINICSRCMIGAGAVVVEDINEPGTYVGVPAKKIK